MHLRIWSRSARTHRASGRSLCLVTLLAGCQLAGGGTPSAPPPEAGPRDPVLEQGPISRAGEAHSARLFRQAEEAFAAGRLGEAQELTGRIIEQYPTAPVSGRALLLNARTARDMGRAADADAAAERYIGLLEPFDDRVTEARLLQAEAFVEDPAARLDRLLRIPESAPAGQLTRATHLAREAVAELSPDELDTVRRGVASDAVLMWIADVRAGTQALEAGEEQRAAQLGRRALAGGAAGQDSVIAEGLLRGLLPGGARRVTTIEIATVLPMGGPPVLADFAELIAEGIEVAAAVVLGDHFDVEIIARDDEGDVGMAASLVAEIEGSRVVGAIGFLEELTLEAGGQVRRRGLPLVSPTARSASRAGEGVYSLEGPDPAAAVKMAQYAADQGYLRVAIVHSQALESRLEADAFEAAMGRLGVPVVGRYAYETDAAFFGDEIEGAQRDLRAAEIAALGLTEDDTLHAELLEPVALFLPIPVEDVELVAPQIIHFGLDTLAIDIIGTSGWTDPQVLLSIDTRHTTGVVATAPVGQEAGSVGRLAFQEAYEAYFQRTLVSPVPAVGYDAALLLLEGLRGGARSPAQVRAAMERLRDIEGATGIFSVTDGRVVRLTEVVYIDEGFLVPIG
jgi:ABC-type branched-subunit amino acid transport system substrate-binding protein